jgi:hypothetical protein
LRYIAVMHIDGRKFRPRPYNAIDYVHKTTRLRLLRGFRFVIAILTCLGVAPALAEVKLLTHDTRFCPSWAEAHERTLASLNNGRPPYPVKWQGCIMLKRGTLIDVVDQQEESTEIVIRGKHWFTDE